MICENCNKEHDGSYGSGRFCSKHCRCSFNSKQQKNYPTKEKLLKRKGFGRKPKQDGWFCSKCGMKFETRAKLRQHYIDVKHPSNQGWSKGLTKETSEIVRKIAQKVSKSLRDGYQSGRIKVSDDFRKRMSEMKKKLYLEHPENTQIEKFAVIGLK